MLARDRYGAQGDIMTKAAVELVGVTKRFSEDVVAVKGLDLTVSP